MANLSSETTNWTTSKPDTENKPTSACVYNSTAHEQPSAAKVDAATASDELLPYDEHNPDASTTMVLIHGAFGSRKGWDPVISHFLDYHLLIPDLPGHADAQAFQPFSISNAANHLATLIQHKAHEQKAHIVGFSLGAHVALNFASHYPSATRDVFISGFEIFPQTAASPYMPYGFWMMQRIENAVPRPIVRWLMDGADLPRNDTSKCTLELCRQIAQPISAITWPDPWPARTLIVAAGKAGILPTRDHPDDARRLREIGQERNSETRAVTHLEMRHPWCLQAPKLFGRAVKAWFEKGEIVNGFVDL